MKSRITLCICWMILWAVSLWAAGTDELAELRSQAAKDRTLEKYSKVCHYLYSAGLHPELLSQYADSIRLLGVKNKSLNCFIEYYAWKSEAYFLQGNFPQGYALKRKAIVLSEKVNNADYITSSSSDMGYYFNVDARYDSARHYLKKALKVGEGHPELADRYRVLLTNYASSFLYEGKTDSALVYTLLAEKRSMLDKDTAMLIENLNQLGTIYRRQKNLDASIESFEKALHLCVLQNNFNVAAYIYGNIATVYSDWNRHEEAIPFSEKAVAYAIKLGKPQMVGICYINLGAIQAQIPARLEESIATLLKAVPFLEEVNNKRRLCEAYGFLTNSYQQTGKMEQAMKYLDKLDKLSDELKTDVERYRYYKVKASFLQASHRYPEAITYYHRVMDMLEGGYRDAKDYEHYLKISACYHAIQKDADAYKQLKQAYQLRDSSFRRDHIGQLSEFAAKYQTAEKELEIAHLRQEQLEQESMILHQRIGYGSVFGLLVVSLLILLYARQRQKARLIALAHASKEKERQFLDLQQKTELRLTRKYIDGMENERQRMAKELHDDVCSNLLALEMKVRTLPDVQDGTVTEPVECLSAIRQRLRTLSHEMMPPVFQYATIDEMLADYISHLELPMGVQAHYSSTEGVDWYTILQTIGFEFYRIVQEAVSNALKYADASTIHVTLSLDGNCLSVQVMDNGVGFDTSKKNIGIGLLTIKQRASSIGAEVILDSTIGEGTCLTITIRV